MPTLELMVTLGYGLVSACFIAPPTEFVSAGITIQHLFDSYLGSEHLHFIQYHIRRTSVTVFAHSCLPLGYYIILGFASPSLSHHKPWQASPASQYLLLVSTVCILVASILIWYWWKDKWEKHPIAEKLRQHASTGTSWHSVASSINVEFRHINKFTTGAFGRRLIVTDSWLITTQAYSITVAFQSNSHLTLDATQEHQLSLEGNNTGVQYLEISVVNLDNKIKPFSIRLNAMEYSDLKDKLSSVVHHARNVVIHQTLSDKFLEAFREQVDQNDFYPKPSDIELEACIGCMQKTSNVKLQKKCTAMNQGDCQQCYCRPMWCLECMGKWFASRQNQQEPETWLGSKCPCPMCRAKFCMLDVCKVL